MGNRYCVLAQSACTHGKTDKVRTYLRTTESDNSGMSFLLIREIVRLFIIG